MASIKSSDSSKSETRACSRRTDPHRPRISEKLNSGYRPPNMEWSNVTSAEGKKPMGARERTRQEDEACDAGLHNPAEPSPGESLFRS